MRAPGRCGFLLVASFSPSLLSSFAQAQPLPPPGPPPVPESAPRAETAPTPSPAEAAPTDAAGPETAATPPNNAPLEERRPGSVLAVGANATPPGVESESDFTRDYHALPLTLEARFGFNARLGSSFDASGDEEHWGASYAFAGYLAWSPEFALGLELDHAGLGRVRALSGQNSVDNEYSATGAWIGARVFPLRRERLDVFVNLRVGLVFQHVDALGTRLDTTNITVPARSFSCAEWDGPGIGIGGALGLAYRLGRRVSLLSRFDLIGDRLSGESLGTCADGMGSVASLGGSVGLTYEFETAPK